MLPMPHLSLSSLTVVAAASSGALVLACTAPIAAPAPTAAPSGAVATVAPGGAASSIDPTIQAIADEELDRTLREFSAPDGVAVVLDASTGQVLADAGRDHGARADLARLHAYVPGSTMKVVTLAAALDSGLASPDDTIDCEQGEHRYADGRVQDSHVDGVLPLSQVVAVSSNVGFAKLLERIGGDRLEHELHALHFGEAPGWIPGHVADHSLAGTMAAVGESIGATPLQVAAAYVAVANGGSYVEPTFTAGADTAGRERVMKVETAHQVLAMLDAVVNTDAGTGTRARVEGARVAGKTGTASYDLPGGGEGTYASFVGIVPEEAPRFVILVGVDQPKDGYGGTTAAPAFARIAGRALAVARR